MTRMQRMVRSLFRAIDLLPYPGFYFVGCISSMLGVGRQRIGDRIAGTLVVQEGRSKLPVTPQMERDWYLAELGSEQRKHIARVLSGEERDLLLQLAIRRHHLDLSARLALNHQARVYFEGRTDWPKPANLPDERYVTALAWAVLPRTPSAKRKTRRTKKTRRTRKTKRTWKRYKADE